MTVPKRGLRKHKNITTVISRTLKPHRGPVHPNMIIHYNTSFSEKVHPLLSSHQNMYLVCMQLFTSQDINWWSGVDYCDFFYQLFGLSFWRHPFTAEHPLRSNWWMLNLIKSDEETNLSTSWMAWVLYQQSFIFGVNYSFNDLMIMKSANQWFHYSLDNAVAQTDDDDKQTGQSPFQSRDELGKDQQTLSWREDKEIQLLNICKPLDLFSVCFQ